jgi:hypothetical protein
MAITQIKGSNIEDGTVLAADIKDDSITNAKIKSDAAIAMTKLAVDPTDASNISSGTLPAGRYTDTVYTHPTTAGNKHIPTAGATDQVLTYSSSGTAAWTDPAGSDPSLDADTSPANWMLGSAAYQDADDLAGGYSSTAGSGVTGISANQNVPTSILTKLILTHTGYNENGDFDLANDRYIVPATGMYLVSASVGMQTGFGSGQRGILKLRKNGLDAFSPGTGGNGTMNSIQAEGNTSTTSAINVNTIVILPLAINDYLDMHFLHWKGSTQTMDGTKTWLQVWRLS